MANAPAWRGEPPGTGSSRPPASWSDEGWDATTHVRSTSAAKYSSEPAYTGPPTHGSPPPYLGSTADATAVDQADTPAATTRVEHGESRVDRRRAAAASSGARDRGIAGWQAVLLLIAIAAVGGAIDLLRGSAVRGGFNIALIVASIVAILLVRRREMFPVLVAPPLVYFVASATLLYIRSSGLHDRSRLLDAAINWLVYGFPAIAAATAAVLIIGGIRLLLHR